MSYRVQSQERDLSGFVNSNISEQGAMVIPASKGRFDKPILCQSEEDVLINAGYPSSDYPGVFEALAFVRKSSLYMVCPYDTIQSKFGGIHIQSGSVAAFSAGQNHPDSFYYTLNNHAGTLSLGNGNGVTKIFSGTLTNLPVAAGSIELLVGGIALDAGDNGSGVISGDDIDSTGTNSVVYASGGIAFKTVTAPASGSALTVNYSYTADNSTSISHSFFAVSPYDDDLSVDFESVSGYKFKLTLYKIVSGNYVEIDTYSYSLIREKDGFGKSLYILDVFKNNKYLLPKINTAYQYTTYSIASTLKVDFVGGRRVDPSSANMNTGWDFFSKAGKYPATIFMDAVGGYSVKMNTIIQASQPYAHGITILTIGNDATELVTERNALSLDSDNISLYANWSLIKDPYNNSEAWISNIGSIGGKYADMADVYDSQAPAGADDDGHGGQLRDWVYLEMDQDFSDPTDVQNLDDAQINPIIFDDTYGVMVSGDKTAQVDLSDTSYIGARRAYNYLISRVARYVLKKQVFKWNDEPHRTKARVMTDDFIAATLGAVGAFREFYVLCDSSNNTDVVLENRRFVLDVYCRTTPTSELCLVRLTRLSQTQVLAELLPTT
jgi:hypothetical protein